MFTSSFRGYVKTRICGGEAAKDNSQMRSFWYGAAHRSRPEGAESPYIYRTFSAELQFGYFQTFHIWLGSFGGFAAKHPSFDTDSLAGGQFATAKRL